MTTICQALGLRDRRPRVAALLLAVVLGLSALPAKAAETITVDGNRRIDAETVRSYFHASSDGRYDEAARDAAPTATRA